MIRLYLKPITRLYLISAQQPIFFMVKLWDFRQAEHKQIKILPRELSRIRYRRCFLYDSRQVPPHHLSALKGSSTVPGFVILSKRAVFFHRGIYGFL